MADELGLGTSWLEREVENYNQLAGNYL
jgi:hypothetical protein